MNTVSGSRRMRAVDVNVAVLNANRKAIDTAAECRRSRMRLVILREELDIFLKRGQVLGITRSEENLGIFLIGRFAENREIGAGNHLKPTLHFISGIAHLRNFKATRLLDFVNPAIGRKVIIQVDRRGNIYDDFAESFAVLYQLHTVEETNATGLRGIKILRGIGIVWLIILYIIKPLSIHFRFVKLKMSTLNELHVSNRDANSLALGNFARIVRILQLLGAVMNEAFEAAAFFVRDVPAEFKEAVVRTGFRIVMVFEVGREHTAANPWENNAIVCTDAEVIKVTADRGAGPASH